MSLAEGITRVMASRGLTVRDVLARLGDKRDRATVYRLLAGNTINPRLDTLLSLCDAIGSTPNELLDQAEVLTYRQRSADRFDLRLRTAFTRIQSLPPETKAVAVTQVLMLLETWERVAAAEPMDDLLEMFLQADDAADLGAVGVAHGSIANGSSLATHTTGKDA